MTKVAKKETATALSTEVLSSWGTEGIDAQDILIPRILLMQGLSEFVNEGKAAAGDIVLSVTGEKLAGKDAAVKFIPISFFKTWVVSEEVGGKYEYRRQEPMGPDNVNDDLEFEAKNKDGKLAKWRRDRSLNFYVLLPDHIEREKLAIEAAAKGDLPNPNDALLPCVLSFRRTSYGAGKELITHFSKCAHFKLPPAVTTFELRSEKIKNDKGHFSVLTVKAGDRTDPYHIATCKRWYDIVSSAKNIRVDDAAEEVEVQQVQVVDKDIGEFMA